jgi:hypothetical protein
MNITWSVYIDGAWHAADEIQIHEWIRQGHLGPTTPVHQSTWPNASTLAEVPSFAALFPAASERAHLAQNNAPGSRGGIPAWVWIVAIMTALPILGFAACAVCVGVGAYRATSARSASETVTAPTITAPQTTNDLTARSAATTTPDRRADPASCPKGQVLIDFDTGRSIHCTGSTEGTTQGTTPRAPTDDDSDVAAKCQTVRDIWMHLDGLDPIISCEAPRPDHRAIRVLVTNAGWDYLGEKLKQRELAKSLLEAYESHWKQFHGWNGGDAANHLVAIFETTHMGMDDRIVATTNANGTYVERP